MPKIGETTKTLKHRGTEEAEEWGLELQIMVTKPLYLLDETETKRASHPSTPQLPK